MELFAWGVAIYRESLLTATLHYGISGNLLLCAGYSMCPIRSVVQKPTKYPILSSLVTISLCHLGLQSSRFLKLLSAFFLNPYLPS